VRQIHIKHQRRAMRRFGVRVEEVEHEQDDWHLARQIAVGILAAAAVLGGIYLWLQYEKARRVEAVVGQFLETVRSIETQHQVERRAAAAARQAAARRRADEELARRRELARKTQAAADQAMRDQAAVAAKERAWQQFYRPPKKCDHPPDWDTQVECGNAHIRAKKEFEDRWSHNKL
jgi:hypothetical protein